jgi:hypothetical protein
MKPGTYPAKPARSRTVLTVEVRRGSGDPWRVWGCYAGRGCWSAARREERMALESLAGHAPAETRITVDVDASR